MPYTLSLVYTFKRKKDADRFEELVEQAFEDIGKEETQ